MEKRNYTIDFFRMIFMIVICIHHFQTAINMSNKYICSGFLCVEFFFILSGFFLYKSFKKNTNQNGIEYTIKRVKKLYPLYLYSFLVLFIMTVSKSLIEKKLNIVDYIFKAISELLLIQNTGSFNGGLNYPMWYLSTLIISGYFIFELLNWDKNFYLKLLGPICIIIYFTFINKNYGTLEVWNAVNGIYIPLLRAFIDMTIGCILGSILDKYYVNIKKSISLHKKFYRILELFNYIILKDTPYQIYSIISFSLLILFANIENSICYKYFNKNIFKNNGDLTYSMYVNHASIALASSFIFKKFSFIQNYINNHQILTLTIYFIILIIYSYCIDNIIKKIIQRKIISK